MTPIGQEWVDKAEEDFAIATRELRVRKHPGLNAICFHAQQCVEKYLKAVLHESGIRFPKTHNLALLLHMLTPLHPSWQAWLTNLQILTNYAVDFRYPGQSADRKAARWSLTQANDVRVQARAVLSLSPSTARKRALRQGTRAAVATKRGKRTKK